MTKLSPSDEFLSLFGGEPTLLDPGVPWAYNTIRFDVRVDFERLVFTVSPGYGECSVEWYSEKRLLVKCEAGDVDGVAVREGGEGLEVRFADPRRGLMFIQVRPEVRITWSPIAPG
jgi:hypothetical protein